MKQNKQEQAEDIKVSEATERYLDWLFGAAWEEAEKDAEEWIKRIRQYL